MTVETDAEIEEKNEALQDETSKKSDDADNAVESADDSADTAGAAASDSDRAGDKGLRRRISWTRLFVFGLLPGLVLLMALGAGYLKWQHSYAQLSEQARIESVRAATDGTIALLSYRPDTVDKDLVAARDRMTGTFRDSYTQLTNDVVIPGSKQTTNLVGGHCAGRGVGIGEPPARRGACLRQPDDHRGERRTVR